MSRSKIPQRWKVSSDELREPIYVDSVITFDHGRGSICFYRWGLPEDKRKSPEYVLEGDPAGPHATTWLRVWLRDAFLIRPSFHLEEVTDEEPVADAQSIGN